VTFRSSRTRDRAVENEPDNRPFLRLGLRLACLWRRRFQAMP
jgi:hypothetical protein